MRASARMQIRAAAVPGLPEKVETGGGLRESDPCMPKIFSGFAWIILATALLVALPGCATSDSDLNYTRDKPSDNPGDHSYHGWNDANY